MKIIMLLFILIVIVIMVLMPKNKKKATLTLVENNYKSNIFMTDNEIEFFHRLVKAFLESYVFPQVAMSGLVSAKSSDFKKLNAIKNTYNRLRVDFVIYKDKKVIAIIELDDKTHQNKEDKDTKRDSILTDAGYKIFRFDSKNKPSIEELKNIIKEV